MKLAFLATFSCLVIAGCAANTPPPAVEIRTVEVVKEVQRPCPVAIPARPAPLSRPLPTDTVALAAVLSAKLIEYAGAGGYADRASDALLTCTKP